MRNKIITEIICGLLILLFIYTATAKWLDFPRFYGNINSQPLPNNLTPLLAWGIPVTEITIASQTVTYTAQAL